MNARRFLAKTCLALLALPALAGCGDSLSNRLFEEDSLYLNALPTDQLQVDAPDSSSAARVSSSSTSSQASSTQSTSSQAGSTQTTSTGSASTQASSTQSCDPDAYRQASIKKAENINGFVMSILTTLDKIKSQPPSERTEDSRIWGPMEVDSGVYARLEITLEAPNFSYELTLSHQPDQGSDVLLSGFYAPGSTAENGKGSFIYDLTVASSYLADSDNVGRLDVVYSTLGAQVDLQIDGWGLGKVGEGSTVDESYAWLTPGDGSGQFYFTQPFNAGDSDPGTLETLTIWSGWQSTGRGRSDVVFAGGDLGSTVIDGEECWDDDQSPSYYVVQSEEGQTMCGPMGDSSSCVDSVKGWNE